ncbi:hypothetical protein D1006_17605 [Burkholderia stabilis]|uniref:HNH endonuclease n=2 Tax=Burkholderia stabilis TaxID=95485 RepID=A0A4Q2AE55_9BURK|nr:hypothetical protein D1006_17605 [Burkholderia stabilis]
MRYPGDDGWLGLAITSKKDNVDALQKNAWDLARRYPAYASHIANSANPPPPSQFGGIKNLMADFYENPPSELEKRLITRRREHQLRECPYCGSPGMPDTLDHFMPKDDWPEFAIYPNNLVPQCRACMPIKGHRYYCTTKNDTLFLHPIYHEMLAQLGFRIDIALYQGVPVFAIKFTVLQPLSATEKKRLEVHIEELQLRERITQFCQREYGIWKNEISEHSFSVVKTLGYSLRRYPAFKVGAAPNWAAAFYKGALQNRRFLRHLASFAPLAPAPAVAEPFDELTC